MKNYLLHSCVVAALICDFFNCNNVSADSTKADFIDTVITSGGSSSGTPNYSDCIGVTQGMIADEPMIVYFNCQIGHFDIYINGKHAAWGRDTSLDGYDNRQWTGILSEGDKLTWSGATNPQLACRMNK